MADYVSSPINAGPISANVWTTMASLTLSPGDWDVSGHMQFNCAGSGNGIGLGIGNAVGTADVTAVFGATSNGLAVTLVLPPTRIVVEGADATVYVSGLVGPSGDQSGGGSFHARKVP